MGVGLYGVIYMAPPKFQDIQQDRIMPEKTVDWVSQIAPFLFALAISSLGGLVGYLNRIDKSGVSFSFLRFTTEIITSGFVGIIAFEICDAASLGWSLTAALVAISGHMGTRALFVIETVAVKTLLRRYGYEDSETEVGRKEKTN
jgi:hypothetical protein